MCTCFVLAVDLLEYCYRYICGSMINRDRTIRAIVAGWYVRPTVLDKVIKSNERSTAAWPGEAKKREATSYCEGSLSSNSISERNPTRIERRSFHNIFFLACSFLFFFCFLDRSVVKCKDSVYIVYTVEYLSHGIMSLIQDFIAILIDRMFFLC